MKRIYTPTEKDEICYEIDKIKQQIKCLQIKKNNSTITAQELDDLDLAKRKLRHLKGLKNGDY